MKSIYRVANTQKFHLRVTIVETGVEIKFKNQHYPVIISATHVQELNKVVNTSVGVRFGASVTLATVDERLKSAIAKFPGI